LSEITKKYHAWRGESDSGKYEDVLGFCKSAKLEEVEKHGFILTPGRYVGIPDEEEDPEVFEEKMKRLVGELGEQFKEGERLEGEIKVNLGKVGLGV